MILAKNRRISICTDCGLARNVRKDCYSILCRSCAQKGERSPAWKGGISGRLGDEKHKIYIREQMRRLRAKWHGTKKHTEIKIRQVDAKRRKLEALAGRPCPEHCEICNRHVPLRYEPYDKYGRLYFDHDHKTGAFRGWVCRYCNSALGLISDDPEILRKMIAYLERKNG